jgi:hypothetical protein
MGLIVSRSRVEIPTQTSDDFVRSFSALRHTVCNGATIARSSSGADGDITMKWVLQIMTEFGKRPQLQLRELSVLG